MLRRALNMGLLRFLTLPNAVQLLNSCRTFREDIEIGALAVAQTRAGRHFQRGCFEDWFQLAPECVLRGDTLIYGHCRRTEHYHLAPYQGEVRSKHTFLLRREQEEHWWSSYARPQRSVPWSMGSSREEFLVRFARAYGMRSPYQTQLLSLVGMIEKFVIHRVVREFDGSSFVLQPLIVPLWKYGAAEDAQRWTRDELRAAMNCLCAGFGDLFLDDTRAVKEFALRWIEENRKRDEAKHEAMKPCTREGNEEVEGAEVEAEMEGELDEDGEAEGADEEEEEEEVQEVHATIEAIPGLETMERARMPPCSHPGCRVVYPTYRWDMDDLTGEDLADLDEELEEDDDEDEEDEEEFFSAYVYEPDSTDVVRTVQAETSRGGEAGDSTEPMDVEESEGERPLQANARAAESAGSDTVATSASVNGTRPDGSGTAEAQHGSSNAPSSRRRRLRGQRIPPNDLDEDAIEASRRRRAFCPARRIYPPDICLEDIKQKQMEYLLGLLEPFFHYFFPVWNRTHAPWLRKDIYQCDGTFVRSESPTLVAGITDAGFLCGVLIVMDD